MSDTTTTTISASSDVMTMINVFKAHEGQQQKLVDVLTEATETAISVMPGFVSASIHRGEDGTSVVNYVQWRSAEHYRAMLADPASRGHMEQAAAIATFDPIVCRPVEVVHAPGEGGRR